MDLTSVTYNTVSSKNVSNSAAPEQSNSRDDLARRTAVTRAGVLLDERRLDRVVGTTDQVAGQIVLDPNDADAVQVGTILINARTLATDSAQRDRAIQNWVLDTADHE